jgi:hypothetical protein
MNQLLNHTLGDVNFDYMKIKFRKLEATKTFIKLFGAGKDKLGSDAPETRETDDAYEYYYKRGNTYYFRDGKGNKLAIDYKKPQKELIRGNTYTMDTINTLNS